MNRNDDQRRDEIRDNRIAQALRAFRRGEIEKTVEGLTIAGARAELAHCLSKISTDVRRQLELDCTKTAIKMYAVLEDDTSLHALAQMLFDRRENEGCTDALLAMKHKTGLLDYLEKMTEREAFDQVARLLPVIYTADKLQANKDAKGETPYGRFVASVNNKLLASFDSGKYPPEQKAVRAPIRKMVEIMEYCGEYDKMRDFYFNCMSAGDRKEWQYFVGQKLLNLSQATHRGITDDIIDFMSEEAIERDDENVIGVILTHRFERKQAMLLADRLMKKNPKQAGELLIRVFEEDGAEPDSIESLRMFVKTLVEKPEGRSARKKKR